MSPKSVKIPYAVAGQIAQFLAQAPAGAVAEPFIALVSAIRAAEALAAKIAAPEAEARAA